MQLREYETIYILRSDVPEEGLGQVNEKLGGVLDREGVKVLRHDVWGKKKLAFELKKQTKGVYVYLNYLGKAGCTKEIERNLRMMEPVLTYQTIKIAHEVDVDRRLAEQEAENQARAAAEAERRAAAERQEAEEAERQAAAAQQEEPATGRDREETEEKATTADRPETDPQPDATPAASTEEAPKED